MEVICAGYPKTGTKSMTKALRILQYKNVYDFEEHLEEFFDEFEKLLQGKGNLEQIIDAYEARGITCVVDAPVSIFFEQFSKRWPKAKIILMIREEGPWFKSFKDMSDVALKQYGWLWYFSRTARRFQFWVQNLFCFSVGSAEPYDLLWKIHYRKHNVYVQNVVPSDKLLIFNVKEGWEPLCKFLGKPIPNEPFPRENQAGKKGNLIEKTLEHSNIAKKMKREALVSVLVYLILLCGGSYYFFKWLTRFSDFKLLGKYF